MENQRITNDTIFTINWAEADPRSVRVSLSKKISCRVIWWNMNLRVNRALSPKSTLEEIMFGFHSRHHSVTIRLMKFRSDMREVAAVIRSRGIVEGIKAGASLK